MNDFERIRQDAEEAAKFHKNGRGELRAGNCAKVLEEQWYASLEIAPDYSVYGSPYYLADIWACWSAYSQKSVKEIRKNLIDMIDPNGLIVDVGCGISFTTIELRKMFPAARVVGTNLVGTWQYELAQELAAENSFEIHSSLELLQSPELIFASEYFEHIERPLEHLDHIVEICPPKFFVIANGFNGTAIGHFLKYRDREKVYSNKEMSKLFWKQMRRHGYEQLDLKIWNNRPSVWAKKKKSSTPPVALPERTPSVKFDNVQMIPPSALVPYADNAKSHPPEQIEELAKLILEYGFRQPVLVDKDLVIITGHGRTLAAIRAGLKEIPFSIADDLTPEQVRAYRIADNKISETDWDHAKLVSELKDLQEQAPQLLALTGHSEEELLDLLRVTSNNGGGGPGEGTDGIYTNKIEAPVYEPRGQKPKIEEVVSLEKTEELIREVEASGLNPAEKAFLKLAAYRHAVFNYEKAADLYAHSGPEFQRLAEKSALVIIDFDKAIENGFVTLTEELAEASKDAG